MLLVSIGVVAQSSAASQSNSAPNTNIKLTVKDSSVVELTRGKQKSKKGSSFKTTRISGVVEIAAPLVDVWAAMLSCESALQIVPHIQKCEIIKTAPTQPPEQFEGEGRRSPTLAWDIRRHIIKYGFIAPRVVNEFRSDFEFHKAIQFEKSGGDLKYLMGEWRLEALTQSGGTRVVYEAEMAIKQPVPGFIVRNRIKKDTHKILLALKHHVEEENNQGKLSQNLLATQE